MGTKVSNRGSCGSNEKENKIKYPLQHQIAPNKERDKSKGNVLNFHLDRHKEEGEGEEVLIPGSFMFDIRIMVTYNEERERERE